MIFKVFSYAAPLFTFLLQFCAPMSSSSSHNNALSQEKSPYLLQHAKNPVHWKPWKKEVLKQAQQEKKLIIISIGYAACHWCHVMEEESFEDQKVAELMNKYYVSIKVDREERPDVDDMYMDAALLLNGQGGWPLNVVALPDGKPVFAGTYFPKDQWIRVLRQLQTYYTADTTSLKAHAQKLYQSLQQFNNQWQSSDKKPLDTLLSQIQHLYAASADTLFGGLARAPKFPMPSALELLLTTAYHSSSAKDLDKFLRLSLDNMSKGGIYDQVGGGFARYSTDEQWIVPHFEKMLYDNAQLLALYSRAARYFNEPSYAAQAEDIAKFLKQELAHKPGAFYASLDADSEGEEGKYYAWTKKEFKEILNTKDYTLAQAFYGLEQAPNFEGKYVLTTTSFSKEELGQRFSLSQEALHLKLTQIREKLYQARDQRPSPLRDEKIILAWNALTVTGFVEVYKTTGQRHYLETATKTAHFILKYMQDPSGNFYRTLPDGSYKISAFLDDYAFMALACFSLYEVTFSYKWLEEAKRICTYIEEHFLDTDGLFFYTSDQADSLLYRKKDLQDNVIPSSNAAAIWARYLMASYEGNAEVRAQIQQVLSSLSPNIYDHPLSYSLWGRLVLRMQYEKEVVLSGTKDTVSVLQQHLSKKYLPHILLAGTSGPETKPLLISNKYQAHQTLIYVCKQHVCTLPDRRLEDALRRIDSPDIK